MSTYVVGDIQGCLQPLKCLLQAVEFNPDTDMLWSVGDIVNRGPKSLKTLRFLYKMRKNLVMVLGNHDLHLLAVAAGVRKPGRSDTLDKILQAPDRDKLLNWLRQQPLIHHQHEHTLVHAGIPPQWTIAQAIDYAGEVEAVLRGPDSEDYLGAMYGDEPVVWSDDLTDMPRLRIITNYLTRMRYCTKHGALDLASKGRSQNPGEEGRNRPKVSPWFEHPKRKAAGDKILFGHWATIGGRSNNPTAIALDTGCVWDGSLSFYQLESGEWTRCACEDGKSSGKPFHSEP